ncbi:YadA-like family protein [Paraburkholderia hiiakae]|uniref:YadA-like family protein n=1 Tax=Paraburkholderia hiiakae TaxID=1081782 RepID=UPI001F3F89E0|nr:YadA-like family protein [Paraburkholderia hiiakae]
MALGNGTTTATAVNTASGVIGGTTYDYAGATPTGVVSVGGAGATRQVTNMSAGQVTSSSTDAVNGSQLFATNTQITKNTSDISNLYSDVTNIGGNADAVKYDSSAHSSVTLGGVGTSHAPVVLKNVATGVDPTDAVNVAQMQNYAATGNPYIGGNGNGAAAQATSPGSVALGLGSVANSPYTISVGNSAANLTRRITNVAPGVASTDAATVGQLSSSDSAMLMAVNNLSDSTHTALQSVNNRLGALSAVNPVGAVADSSPSNPWIQVAGPADGSDPAYATPLTGNVAIGQAATATVGAGVAIGAQARSTGTGAVAIGTGATAANNGSTAVGLAAQAIGSQANAIGYGAVAQADNSTALGMGANALGTNSMAFGNYTSAAAMNSVVIGQNANVDSKATGSMAIGYMAKATSAAPSSVALGTSSVVDRANSVSVGSSKQLRQIIYVANGTVSTDAVNVSQLTSAVSAFGGNATVGADGSVVNPSYVIGGKTYSNVGDALNAVGGVDPLAVHYDGSSMASVTLGGSGHAAVKLTNVANGGLNASSVDAVNGSQLYALGATTDASGNITNAFVAYDDSSKSAVTLGGSGHAAVKVKNVAAGDISNASSTDAVNGGQLYTTNQSISNLAGDVTNISGDITKIKGTVADSVLYDSSAHDSVTLGGSGHAAVKLTNVANGALSASSIDAVNGSQLYALGATTDASGNITNAFVTYDDSSKSAITLGGSGHAAVKVKNVAAGDISNASSTDAVNGGQLYTTNQSVSNLAGDVTNISGDITKIKSTVADAVLYDSSAHDSVTLGGSGHAAVKLTNVANGALSASSIDAVNGSQLYALGATTDASGNITNAFVTYDDSSKSAITLGGSGHAAVKVKNVAAGDISNASSTDAVNGGQLYTTNQSVSNLAGDVTNISGDITKIKSTVADSVLYDSSAHDSVTLGGSGHAAVKLTNVANGALSASSIDAVNGSQLYALGATTDASGNITNAFVTYDDSSKSAITLGGSGHAAVKVKNVAAGDISNASSTDAVNGGQLYTTNQSVSNLAGDVTNISGDITKIKGTVADSVLYDSSAHDSVTLGGSGHAAVKLTNVANGALSASSIDAVNGSQLYALGATTDASGNITNAFVTYDDTSKSVVTLGGSGHAPVTLKNVAAGVEATDAVNVAQMTQAVITGNPYIGGSGSGVAAKSTAVGAVALGLGSVANTPYTISVGDSSANLTRRITNVSAGAIGTDAVNLDQLNAAMGGVSATMPAAVDNMASDTKTALKAVNNHLTALSAESAVGDSGSNPWVQVAGPADGSDAAYATPLTGNVAIGQAATSTVGAGVAIGASALSTGTGAVAVGTAATATNTGSFAMGTSATASGAGANALGYGAVSLGTDSNALSAGAYALANNALAIGFNSSAAGTNSMAIGLGTKVDSQATNSIALGSKANVTSAAQNSVALGSSSVADRANSIAVGSSNQQRQIIYVANGTASTDAVNVSQLTAAVSAFGGNATVGADGSIVQPTYIIGGKTYSSVGDAIDALGDGGGGGTATDPLAVHYDGTSMSSVTLGGTGAAVKLTNVANGGLTASSVDAVNGSQLYALGAKTDDAGNLLNAFVAYDDTSMSSVTLGGGMNHAPVALHNVAAGVVSASSFDAVNGTQLYGVASSTATALGGNSKVNADGSIGVPTYVLSNQTYNDVGTALDAVMEAAKGGGVDAVVYDDGTHTKLTLGGQNTTTGPVALTNVANGEVAASSVDAVNGSQLYALGAKTDASGNLLNAFVAYDDTSMNSVTFGGANHSPVALHNIANGALNASSFDAVNGSQLYALGAKTDGSGNLLNAFVAYDNTSMSKITLGGVGSKSPVVLTNVAAGQVTASSVDAVNGSQLYALGAKTDGSGNLLNAFVAYDNTSKGSVTLGGAGSTTPVALHNVANGTTAYDAVNYAQLQAMGAQFDKSGNVTNAFVAYDDTSMSSITLGGNMSHAPVVIHNVANGALSASSLDAVNGTQLYNTASTTADALGGGSTVNGNGSISAPTYNVGGNTFTSVGDVITNLDGRVTNLDGRVTNIEKTITSIAGDVTNISAQVANAVQYDSTAHDKITLGGTGSTSTVKLTNLSDGELSASSSDAVTGAQLYATNQHVADLGQQIQNIGDTGSQYISTNTTSGAASATGSNSIAAGGGATASGANSTAIGDKASATGNNSVALGANSVADEDNTVSVGSQGNERRITNVANGVNPTDAANMGQLQSGLNALQSNVNSVARNAYGGVAAATALTMIPDVDQGKTIAVGVGTANFQGYQAVALGASARITQNIKVKLGGGYASGGGATYGGGMSYQW